MIDGTVAVTVRPAGDDRTLLAVAITVTNEVAWEPSAAGREEAVRHSLVGAHLLLAVDDGRFLSSIDPPASAAVAVAGCTNEGLFPVLVGSAGRDDMMLAAPIILYDHPEVAPESPGDMFDATEIDEILALRVLTLTDDEKAQARRTDPRAAAIVDRCDDMPPELWSRLHGAIRTLRPTDAAPPADDAPWWDPDVDEQFDPFTDTLRVAGVAVTAGSTVTLHPLRRADAHDMFFAGRRPPSAGCSATSTARCWWASRSTTTRRARRWRGNGGCCSSIPTRSRSTTDEPGTARAGGRHRQHLPRRRRLGSRGGPPPRRRGAARPASGSPTSGSAGSTSPTSCSRATRASSSSTPSTSGRRRAPSP